MHVLQLFASAKQPIALIAGGTARKQLYAFALTANCFKLPQSQNFF
jgi:hypothetical protein